MRGSQHVLCSQTLALGDGGSQKFDSDVMDMFKMHECNDIGGCDFKSSFSLRSLCKLDLRKMHVFT